MKLADYKGFQLRVPSSGGKAGKGHNLTSTIQVFDGVCVLKAFRFSMTDYDSGIRAAQKARAFIDNLKP